MGGALAQVNLAEHCVCAHHGLAIGSDNADESHRPNASVDLVGVLGEQVHRYLELVARRFGRRGSHSSGIPRPLGVVSIPVPRTPPTHPPIYRITCP